MTNYEIIDNFLTDEQFNIIAKVMMSHEFPWFYSENVTSDSKTANNNTENFYFGHLFSIDGERNSNFYGMLKPLFEKLNTKAIVRAKANLYPNVNKVLIDPPHTDYDYDHKGAILYINTNNGCTVLEDGTKVNSVANRVLLFNPSKLHHTISPTDEKIRVNININYF